MTVGEWSRMLRVVAAAVVVAAALPTAASAAEQGSVDPGTVAAADAADPGAPAAPVVDPAEPASDPVSAPDAPATGTPAAGDPAPLDPAPVDPPTDVPVADTTPPSGTDSGVASSPLPLGLDLPTVLGMVSPRNGAATVGITKTVSRSTLQPGDEVEFRLVGSCSSLTVDCVDFTLTDVLPAELEVTSLPASNSQRTVSFDPVSRRLTIAYKVSLGAGRVGLPAGSSQSVAIGMRLPTQTAVANSTAIDNTASATSANAPAVDDTATVTADIPVRLTPVATKAWAPSTAIAQSDAPSTITLGVRNASTSSSRVDELTVADTTAATWERFDLVDGGTVGRFPAGADRVQVAVCTLPLPGGCRPEQFTVGPLQSGPVLSLPIGAAPATVTGVRYVFTASSGADLPFDATPAEIDVPVRLRSTYRTSGALISPTTTEKISNCATATVGGASGSATSSPVCAPFAIQPDSVTVTTAKTMFSDPAGTYAASGAVVAGQDSGVSMRITAVNDSAFAVPLVRITEPSPTATTDFAKLTVTEGRLTFPTGATTATLTVDCRSGADPVVRTIPRPSSGVVSLDSLGCAAGVGAASVTVEYRGVSVSGAPLVAGGSTATLELHGMATGAVMSDVTDGGLTNCAAATMASQVDGTGSATSQACTAVGVQSPRPGVGSGSKTTNGVTSIVAGQPLTFGLSFRNTGNVPVSNVVLADPPDPTAPGNPFATVSLASLKAATAAPDSRLEVYDPTVAAYVPHNAGDVALLARARGIRVTVTGDMTVGQTFRVEYAVRLRPGATATSFRNCAAVGIGSPSGSPFCGPQIVVGIPGSGGNLNKSIEPPEVVRPKPGLPPQFVTVKHRVQNTGTLYLKRLVVTDVDADFFDAIVFRGSINVNFPVGANRVQVDVCTSASACAAGTWVTGSRTSSSSPSIPSSVAESAVKGIRFTFSNSNNGYEILPAPNYPTSGKCPGATVCFRGEVRAALASNPAAPLPDRLSDTSSAAGESALEPPGTTFAIPSVTATADVVQGRAGLDVSKSPNSRIGPGDVAPVAIVVTNTGTDVVTDPIVRDPLPAGLTLDPVVDGALAGQPYTLDYTLPAGVAPPSAVQFTQLFGDAIDPPVPGCTDVNRTCGLQWSFPGWNLPPGGVIRISFDVTLTPGVLAGQVIVNTAGAQGANDPVCAGTSVSDDPAFGPGEFCTDRASVTTLAGDDFTAQKWIAADPALGFRSATGEIVSVDSAECPRYLNAGVVYTRFPCTARVRPGQPIDYLIRGVNSGTNPASSIVLVDGLPVDGDTGVLLSGQDRGTAWSSRPTLFGPVTMVEGRTGVVTTYTSARFPGSSFCTADLRAGAGCPATAFDEVAGPAVTGFRTVMTFAADDLLAPGESFTLVYRMTAPASLASARQEPIAWNSFAYRPTFRLPGGGTNTLPATEPLKVGVGMPLDAFTVTKRVEGLPPGVTVGSAGFAWSCTVDLADDTTEQVARGTFALADGETFESPQVPLGAECRVWETDAQGGQSDVVGEENAASLVVGDVSDDLVVVNNYAAGSLTVTKRVEWDDVPPVTLPGPFQVTVECAFPSLGDLLPGFPRAIDLVDGQSETIADLPVGTACVIEETERRGAIETSIDSSNGSPEEGDTFITRVDAVDDGGTVVTVTNTYTTGGVELVKQLVGDATAWAQGPFTFRVACVDPTNVLDRLETDVVLDPTELSAVVSPIPTGYECTVTEVSTGDAASWSIEPASAVTIPAYTSTPPGPVQVTITNAYPAGRLTVEKTVQGDAADVMAGAVFGVNVRCERDLVGGAGTQVFLDTIIDISDGERVVVSDSLPIGARCWAREVRSVGATSVDVSHTQSDPLLVSAEDPDGTIRIVNTYSAGGNRRDVDDQSGIEVVKRLVGPGAARAEGPFEIRIDCSLDGFELPVRDLVLDVNRLVAFVAPLPVGADCIVVEIDAGNAVGEVPRFVARVTVPGADADPVQVVVVNEFPADTEPGDGGSGGGDPDGGGSDGGGTLPQTGLLMMHWLTPGATVLLVLGVSLLFVARRSDRRRRTDP